MAWADPTGDLRRLLADTTADNFVKEQDVLGPRDGTNRTFYTFQDRLTTSGRQSELQTGFVALRAWHNQSELPASGILVIDAERGEFTLMVTPAATDRLTAAYHFQRHYDGELSEFLTQAIALVNVSAVGNTPAGLQGAVLYFAAALAHEREAQRWMWRKAEQFMLHDAPQNDPVTTRVTFHREQADRFHGRGLALRKDYYDLRQDRGRAPAFALLKRTPSSYGPRR